MRRIGFIGLMVGLTMQTHYHTIAKDDYDRFPLDEEKYVGFRFIDADRFRQGWMKIMLYNNEGNYFVKLLETAIQEYSWTVA